MGALPHGKGQTSRETASLAPSANEGQDKALREPLVSLQNRWGEVEQVEERQGESLCFLQGHRCGPQVACTELVPQMSQQ